MKKIFFLLITTASFVACKKNNIDAPVTTLSAGAKVKTETYGASIATFTYDAQGRITLRTYSNGSKVEYDYLSGIVNEKVYNTAGVYQYSYKYELNADGSVNRETSTNNPGYEDLMLYNADKTLAKGISKVNGNTTSRDFFYSNGNCDSIRFNGNNGSWQTTIVNTYYTDKANVLSYENHGYSFYGKDNKNLLKNQVYKYPDGSTNTPSGYSYEFDALGRVIKQSSVQGNNQEIGLFTYY
jgi:YD repeat-containing protein